MNALKIADIILKIAARENKELTPQQIVKLTVLAQQLYLWKYKEVLFGDAIEAWTYGPVIPSVYHATRGFGNMPIPMNRLGNQIDIGEDILKFLEVLYQSHKHLSGVELSLLTNYENSPWEQCYKPGINAIIPVSTLMQMSPYYDHSKFSN